MGIFDKLFGSKKQEYSKSSAKHELRTEYNIMKDISLEKCQKYENSDEYKLVESGIYQDLKDEDDAKYRMTISYELEPENTTNNQYPLEDILDKYYLYVSDFLEFENNAEPNSYKLELGGELNDIKKSQEIIGKKVFNQEYKDVDGQVRVILKIE